MLHRSIICLKRVSALETEDCDGRSREDNRGYGPIEQTGSCSAKNLGVQRRLVISQMVALAPSSQNSAGCGCAGLAQAQDTHMKPSTLFCRASSARVSAGRGASSSATSAMPRIEPQPPAGPS